MTTYDKLENAARSGDLMLLNQVIDLKKLQSLTCKTQVLADCTLLQNLEILLKTDEPPVEPKPLLKEKEYILNFIRQHQLLSQRVIYEHAHYQFAELTEDQVYQIIQQLCQEKCIDILDQNSPPPARIVCLVAIVTTA